MIPTTKTISVRLNKSQTIAARYIFSALNDARDLASAEFGDVLADAGVTADPGYVRYNNGVVEYDVQVAPEKEGPQEPAAVNAVLPPEPA